VGQRPSTPLPIPQEVLLQVVWPEQPRPGEALLRAQGRTAPHNRVRVDGRLVVADAEGRFEIERPLELAPQRLTVVAEDPAGKTKQSVSPAYKKTLERPSLEVDVGEGVWE